MNQKSYQAVTTMMNAFPQTSADLRGLLLTYDQALTGVSDQAIEGAALRFVRGDVPGQSRTFAPSIAEFVADARRCQEALDIKAKPRITAPRYTPGPLAPFQIRTQRKLAENSHLPVLFEDIGFDEWRRKSKAREIPTDAKWVAATGIIYGPAPKAEAA